MKPDFIISGTGNYNSLGVLHAMAEAEVDCFVLCVGKSKDGKSGNLMEYRKCPQSQSICIL